MSSSRTSPDHDGVALSFPPVASGGPNNPAALRQALRAAVSPDDITAIAEVLRELALDGNLSAIRLLLSYVVGRPGAPDKDDAEPESPPAPAPAPEGPAPAQRPEKDPPPVCAAASEPRTPAPPASPSPSVTVVNGPAPRPPAPPPAERDERPPLGARRRWPP